ncbi:hypothetical protein LXL04_024981 [Taraxacum kok-saghyz]
MRAAKNMNHEEEFDQLKRGPWTLEEDNLLIRYINCHGEGRWNSLAKSAGLKRTGKSCRLRWLNYLKPDTKRGNLTPQEQLMILELHSKWGNRWSKIAQHLPGRTDNEIKNYWRTRVQKQARHLKIDCSSKRFVDALHRFWMPRLLEKVEQTSSSSSSTSTASISTMKTEQNKLSPNSQSDQTIIAESSTNSRSSIDRSSDSSGKMLPQLPEMTTQLYGDTAFDDSLIQHHDCYNVDIGGLEMMGYGQPDDMSSLNFQKADTDWITGGDMEGDTYWNMDEFCFIVSWFATRPESVPEFVPDSPEMQPDPAPSKGKKKGKAKVTEPSGATGPWTNEGEDLDIFIAMKESVQAKYRRN